MRLSLADWLRRLADRVAPRTARAGARAGFQQVTNFYGTDIDEVFRQWQGRKDGGATYTGER